MAAAQKEIQNVHTRKPIRSLGEPRGCCNVHHGLLTDSQLFRLVNVTFTTAALAVAIRMRVWERTHHAMGAVGSSPFVITLLNPLWFPIDGLCVGLLSSSLPL